MCLDRHALPDSLCRLVATVGGLGRVPKAPGTAGALAGLLAAVLWDTVTPWKDSIAVQVAVLALFIPIGIFTAGRVARLDGLADPQHVVVDEFAGQWLALAFLAPADVARHPVLYLAGFLLFRLLDIAKPLGIRRLEKLPGGWGIMADDLAAGAVSAAVLCLARVVLDGGKPPYPG